MARNKEALVLVLDVSPAMHPYLDAVSKATSSIVQRKLHHSKGDELGLVLFGTEVTDNELTDEVGGYENIISESIRFVDGNYVQRLKQLPKGPIAGDFVDAVVVAVDLIVKKAKDGLKGHRRICLITDGQSPVKLADGITKLEQAELIASRMSEQNIKFDTVIVRIDTAADAGVVAENDAVLGQLYAQTEGESVCVDSAVSLLGALKPRNITPTTLYRGDMEITPSARVKVWVYKKVSQERFPMLKNYSDKAATPFATHEVKLDTEYKSSDDPTISIPPDQRAKGYYYGQQLIPVTPDMEKSLKFTTEKGLKLLGFTEKSNIPRHYYMKEPNVFIAEPGNEKSITAISALARALRDAKMVAIVRCVWRQGQTSVSLGVLTPNVSSEDNVADCLYSNVIPFAEDIREFGFPSLEDRPTQQPSDAQQQMADKLVEMLDLLPPGKQEALQPERTINPSLQRFYDFLYKRSTNPESPVPPIDSLIRRIVEMDINLASENESLLKDFSSQFTLTVNLQKDKGSAKFWRDKPRADEQADGDGAGASQDVSQISFDSGIGRQVEEVGSLNPIEDFEALLARRDSDEWVSKAIQGMQKMILDLLDSSYKGNTYGKALSCLVALRKGCVIQEEPEAFNKFYRDLAMKCQARRLSDFWQQVASDGMIMITKDETPDSEITQEEAVAFLSSGNISQQQSSGAEPEEEIDEMDALLDEAI